MSAEEGQKEFEDCEGSFFEERELDSEKIKEPRLEEAQFIRAKELCDVVPWPKDGCPVSVRWVDVVEGDGSTRSRLVAKDFKRVDRHLLEAVRAVLNMAATKSSDGRVKKVMMIDAKKAHINLRCREDIDIRVASGSGSRS